MGFVRKFLVLKECAHGYSVNGKGVSGVARAECEDKQMTLSVSLINLTAVTDGCYVLFTVVGGKRFSENIGVSPLSPSFTYNACLDDGFACLVAHVVGGKVMPVIGGACAETRLDTDALTRALIEEIETENSGAHQAAEKNNVREKQTYDDDVVATENYFLADDADAETLTIKENAKQLSENISPAGAESQTQNGGEKKESAACGDEERVAFGQKQNYFARVESELNGVFAEYPEDHSLDKTLPDGKWARVSYGQDKFYVVGLIYEKGGPKYICYGVPAKYSRFPPKELAGFCSFIPISVFDMRGDGYWMMFQDAETGECVRMN